MAKAAGRLAVLSKAATAIGGVRMTSIKFSAEPIDVTDMDSNGVIELLAAAKTTQCELTVEGIAEDVLLRALWTSPTTSKLLTDITFKYADALAAADTVAGNFFLTSYEEGNPYDDAATFKATMVSSGTWTIS
jgi:predicted secreted protein